MTSGSSDPKLYVRVACSVCLGGKRGVFMNCPYCSADRMTHIEASFKSIAERLQRNLTDKEKAELIICLQDKK